MAKKEPKEDLSKDIIKELSIALGKLKLTDLKQILDQYKKKPDEVVVENLLEWNTNFIHRDEQENEDDRIGSVIDDLTDIRKLRKPPPPEEWIELQNTSFKISFIMRIDRDENYDFSKNKMYYSIIINKIEEAASNKSSVLYANTEIHWSTKKERDDYYQELKVKLQKHNIVFI